MTVEEQGTEAIESQVEGSEGGGEPAVQETPPDTRSAIEKHIEAVAAGKKPAERGTDGKFKAPAAKDEPRIPPEVPPGQVVTPEAGAAVEKPAYAPSYKYKVMDKELEIPEAFRALMKDDATSKEVRELFEKANGLEHVKGNLQRERDMRKSIEGEYQPLAQQVMDMKGHYQRKDWDSFFGPQGLNVPFDELLQYVHFKLQYEKLPPDQRMVLDERKAAQQRTYQLERQGAQSSQQHEVQLAQAVQHGLSLALAGADVRSASDAYDARVGKPGAFREEVVKRGEFYWVTQGKLIPPDQAVQEVLGLIGPVAPAQASAQPAAAAAQASATTPPAPQAAAQAPQTPVIPNVQGKSTSPLPTKPRSLQDLKNLAAKM